MPDRVVNRSASPEEAGKLAAMARAMAPGWRRFWLTLMGSLAAACLSYLLVGPVVGLLLQGASALLGGKVAMGTALLWAFPAYAAGWIGVGLRDALRARRRVWRMSELLRQDLSEGGVREEEYRFVALKSFAEPEHGGLVHFRRSDAGTAVFTIAGDRPLTDALRIVRAPRSQAVLALEELGMPMEPREPPAELTAPPASWPDDGDVVRVTWSRVATVFAKVQRPAGARR